MGLARVIASVRLVVERLARSIMAKVVHWKIADKDASIFADRQNLSSNDKAYKDPVIELMRKYAVEMTKENYIYYSFMGDVPETLDSDFLATIPTDILEG